VLLVLLVQEVSQVQKVMMDLQLILVPQVLLVLSVLLVQEVSQVQKVMMDLQLILDQLVLQV
jgi:hypothetical protein